MFNGCSAYSKANSHCMAEDDRVIRSLPWTMRMYVPGFEAGWPAR